MFAHVMTILATLGVVDWAALAAALAGFWYLFFRKPKNHGSGNEFQGSQIKLISSSANMTNGSSAGRSMSLTDSGGAGFVGKMKSSGRHVLVFYGSQTGTAEDLANRLAKDAMRYGMQKGLALDPEDCDVEEIGGLNEIENSLFILCLATYGEGDPTDNAQELYEFLKRGDVDLTGVNYAVFGLGNKTYEHFNAMAKFTDKRLAEMGAKRIYELGLGDDDGNLEEDFMLWRENFWPAVCEAFDIQNIGEDVCTRQYKLTVHEPGSLPIENIFWGEIARLNSYVKQKPPYDLKNPFLARVKTNRELHTGGDRSCKHIEFDISDSRLRYEAGDHVAVYPSNDAALVEKFGEILGVDLDTVITLTNVDEDAGKRNPFCCPCTYRTALTHYVDIASVPKMNVIKEIAEYCSNSEEKTFLESMISTKEESRKKFLSYIVGDHRTVLDLMQDLPSCRPTLDHLLELMPRLQARYYSISSSPKCDPGVISITAVVLKYASKIGREVNGVATRYLAAKKVAASADESPNVAATVVDASAPAAAIVEPQGGNASQDVRLATRRLLDERVPIFVRKSQLRLPRDLKTPCVMIGPGTGLAPFRGFLHERRHQRRLQTQRNENAAAAAPYGATILYFGCRDRQHDFIYRDELQSFLADGTLTELHVAPSREHLHRAALTQQQQPAEGGCADAAPKTYVQHLLRKNGAATWRLIFEQNAHFYVCGDARNMARDVLETFLDLCVEFGRMDREAAQAYVKRMETQKRYQADVWS